MRILLIGGTRFIGRSCRRVRARRRARRDDLPSRPARRGPVPRRRAPHRRSQRRPVRTRGRQLGRHGRHVRLLPRQVHELADVLGDRAGHYQQVSSVSAYASPASRGYREDAPLAMLDDPDVEEVTDQTYGGLKVLCERVAVERFGPRSIIVRPTYVVGPGRLHVAVPVVGGADRPWRRRARTRPGRRAVTGHRCPGHGGLDGRPARAGRVRARSTRSVRRRRSPGASSSRPSPTRSRPRARRCSWVDADVPARREASARPRCRCGPAPTRRADDDGRSRGCPGDRLLLRPLAETVRDTLAWTRTAEPAARSRDSAAGRGSRPAGEVGRLSGACRARCPGTSRRTCPRPR